MNVSWHQAGGRPVRSLTVGRPRDGTPTLVVVPGLGALGYLRPMVSACSTWTSVTLLDVPGFGHAATARCPSSLDDLSTVVANWLRVAPRAPVLLLGHSTGAQGALRAALAVPQRVAGLVLAGPTFPPQTRRWAPLLFRMAQTALHEPPVELPVVLPEFVRSRGRFLTLLRTAMSDRPEDVIGDVACPLLTVRGRHDAVSPQDWVDRLGASGRVMTLPGAHNFPFTHPEIASDAIRETLT